MSMVKTWMIGKNYKSHPIGLSPLPYKLSMLVLYTIVKINTTLMVSEILGKNKD